MAKDGGRGHCDVGLVSSTMHDEEKEESSNAEVVEVKVKVKGAR
jgi:hypothetical protein